ncbi:hypothetical protein JCM24511_03542 [Saitozyma sp. JCM 24511]|nr:hypothetical protein JCM24511_03542 [Saitozyma sp. JCM 24511]
MSEFTTFDSSLDFLVSPGSGSKLGESSRSASGPSPDMTGGGQSGSGSGEKRASMDEQGEADSEGRKKQKFSRSRTACLQCRARKSKCGALPPNPCPNCVEAHLTCQWPAEDGRSSRARLQRARSMQIAKVSGASGEGVKQEPGGAVATGDGDTQLEDTAWLDRLLATGSVDTPPGASSGVNIGMTSQSQAYPLPGVAEGYPNLSGVMPNTAFAYPMSTPSDSQAGSSTLPFTPSMFDPSTPGFMAPAVDPTQFMWAMSSRLPMVEESSPNDERTSASGPSPLGAEGSRLRQPTRRKGAGTSDGKIVKISWWRPHGQTAIAPGLKRITLKVRVDSPQETLQKASPRAALQGPGDTAQEVIAADGAPSTPIMRHLLDVFMVHFGCQFPFLDRQGLETKIENRTGSVFLLNCVAAMAARFSGHSAIALPTLQPWAYGNVFYNRARSLLGSMLGVPSRETVAGLVMLAHVAFANDAESELWMMTGMAVRMAVDLGLHINPPPESSISEEDRRLNRLVFWSVLLMDYVLSFGVGRQTTFRVEDITQTLPTEEDIRITLPCASPESPRSPFPYAAKMMISYGPLINMLNREQDPVRFDSDIQSARAAAIKEYNHLPQDMQWNVGNLQRHCRANQGPIFLHLHLWLHTILASGFLTGSNLLRRGSVNGPSAGLRSGAATPTTATASTLWRNSARTIGDILVLTDIINPYSYFALPFVNQAFFVAGCCYVKGEKGDEVEEDEEVEEEVVEEEEVEEEEPASPAGSPKRVPASLMMTSASNDKPRSSSTTSGAGVAMEHDGKESSSKDESRDRDKEVKQVDLSRALLTSVATTNISTLQQGLSKQTAYWSGVAWISSALEKRIEGIQDVDLVGVTEKLASFVSLPDAGLVGRSEDEVGETPRGNGAQTPATNTHGGFTGLEHLDFGDLDFLSLPFDLGTIEGGISNVTEQEVPLPQSLHPEWFR